MSKNHTITFNNGMQMPMVSLGCYMLGNTEQTVAHMKKAIEIGYRAFDTAMIYKNEESVGQAVRESGIPREELFVSTKLWTDDVRNANEMGAFNESLKRLGLDYVDLYLIHWPSSRNLETWKIMQEIYESGKARSIGVSNFKKEHLEEILTYSYTVPVVNQIELHPFFNQKDLVSFCNDNKIKVESWSPFLGGDEKLLKHPVLEKIAHSYNKSVAQIILRWNIQQGIVPLPRAHTLEHLSENIDIFDFELSSKDMSVIDDLHTGERFGIDPDNIELILKEKREQIRENFQL